MANSDLRYLALSALLLILTTFLVTRILYVRRIAKCQAQNLSLQQKIQLLELHSRIEQTVTRKPPQPVQTPKWQQVIATIAAVGSLSALVLATTPVITQILLYYQGKTELTLAKEVLTFAPHQWREAESASRDTKDLQKKEVAHLKDDLVYNSTRDTISVAYDGHSPAIIDSEKSITIAFKLDNPSTGLRLLVRPIRAPGSNK
jgi:hypothetical protein